VGDWSRALEWVCEQWAAASAEGRLRSSSAARYGQVFGAFCRFAEASGAISPESVTAALCRRFIIAPSRGGSPPCAGTSRLRLTVIRSAFEALTSGGAVDADPTTELRVPHRAAERVPTPLTPPEATRLVMAGHVSPRDTLRPATCALALMGAAHAEIAGAVISAFSEVEATIGLGAGRSARVVAVPPHLFDVLHHRAAGQRASWRRRGLPWDPAEVPLALNRALSSYPVNSVAPTVSDNLSRALRHAGIQRAEVQPKSVREYAANAVYATTHRIEAVSEQLGVPSYDTAARLIDPAWQEQWGDAVRAGGRG